MLTTTHPNFEEAVMNLGRHTYGCAILDFIETGAIKKPTVTASSTDFGITLTAQVAQGYLDAQPHDILGMSDTLMPAYQGWRSRKRSNSVGNFVEPEWLEYSYSETVSSANFMFVADFIYFPKDFVVEYRKGQTWYILEEVFDHTGEFWYHVASEAISFDGLRISVSQVMPRGGNVQIMFFGPIHRLIYGPSKIRDFTVTEDLLTESENPLGDVNSNYLDFLVDNGQGWFTPSSEDSPLRGLIKEKIVVRPFMGIKCGVNTDDPQNIVDVYEVCPLGHFYVTEWQSNANSLETSILAYDRLRPILEADVPMLPVQQNMSIPDFVRLLFSKFNLVEGKDYTIDPAISTTTQTCWTTQEKMAGCLSDLSIAGSFTVNVSRLNVIELQAEQGGRPVSAELSGADMLVSSDNPQLFRTVFNTVEVFANAVALAEPTQPWYVEDQPIAAGATYDFGYISFGSDIANISHIEVTPKGLVPTLSYGSRGARLSVKNTTAAPVLAKIAIQAQALELAGKAFTVNVPGEEKKVTIEVPMIQHVATATQLGNRLLTFLQDAHRETTNNWRVDPRLELGDVVKITNPSNNVTVERAVIKSMTTNFVGGFDGEFRTQRELV